MNNKSPFLSYQTQQQQNYFTYFCLQLSYHCYNIRKPIPIPIPTIQIVAMSNKFYITNFHLLFRASELEVENEKLRQDYQLLRNSINRGVESRELEGKFTIEISISISKLK